MGPAQESDVVHMARPRLAAWVRTGMAAAIATLATAASAQQQGVVVTPSLAVTGTYTTNRNMSQADQEADLITEITPAVSISSQGGRFRGNLRYALTGVAYARDSELSGIYHTMAGDGRFELVEGRAGIVASTAAGRNVVSAFGTQYGPGTINSRANLTQTFSYSLAPYLTGVLPGDVQYLARTIYTESKTDSRGPGDTGSGTVSLAFSKRLGDFDAALEGSRTIMERTNRARSHMGGVTASFGYQSTAELGLRLRVGTESSDLLTGQSEQKTTWGAGLAWVPGPRTKLQMDFDRRFFGQGHSVLLSHRMSRTIVTFNDTRSFQTGGVTGRGFISAYDLFFAQFASNEPDPVRRDQLVRTFLSNNGLDPDSQLVIGGFAAGGPLVQRAQQLAFAYNGLRNSVVFTVLHTRSSRLGNDSSTGGDLSNVGSVDQRGANLSWSYRLTPISSVILTTGFQRTAGSGAFGGNDLRTVLTTWSTRLSPDTAFSLTLRRSLYDNDQRPYGESAVIATVRMQF